MNGTPFKLGTFAKPGGRPFVAIVLGDDAIELAATRAIDDLLEDWDANFSRLQEMVAAIEKDGRPGGAETRQACARCRRCCGPAKCSTPRRIFRSMSTKCCAPA